MILPRRVARSVLLGGILLLGAFVFYLLTSLTPSPPPPPLTTTKTTAKTTTTTTTPTTITTITKEDTTKDDPEDHLDWSTVKFHHNHEDLSKELPTERPLILPRVQADASSFSSSSANTARREAVRDAFERSYRAYRKHAWMRDELQPVTGGAKDPFGGWAATLVDCLDTLWIMGFRDEFAEAAAAVGDIDWSRTSLKAANMFETTIRYLGGLLSAYDLSGEPVLLRKAVELAEMLFHGFDTPNGMPGFWLDFARAKQGRLVAGTNDASASPCSLSLEFTRLSQITGDAKYYAATDRITRFLDRVQNDTSLPGLWPTYLNFREEKATDRTYTLGASADSLYEYLPKMHALLGGVDAVYEKLFRGSMDAAIENLLFRPMLPGHDNDDDNDNDNDNDDDDDDDDDEEDILFSGEYRVENLQPSSQHLTCFAGGMFALGGRLFRVDKYVSIGARLARGCAWAYAQFPTGIMPEVFEMLSCETLDAACAWDEALWERQSAPGMPRGFTRASDKSYILRPEAIESVFVMYRITGDDALRDTAWDMFESIMRATRTELANSAISDVTTSGPTQKTNSMESFWMAETLKYFYLIFSEPELISLDEWVFNTEAHPFKRPRGDRRP